MNGAKHRQFLPLELGFVGFWDEWGQIDGNRGSVQSNFKYPLKFCGRLSEKNYNGFNEELVVR
jgi:hypothetical protein